MRSSNTTVGGAVAGLVLVAGFLSVVVPSTAAAQQPAQGFAVERFYPSAPGAGWFVMDDLDLHGDLGGAMQLTLGYERNPLSVADRANPLTVVADQAFADIAAALTWRRWRFSLNLDSPLVLSGESGTSDNYTHVYVAPSVSPGSHPDTMADARIGTDVRIVGQPGGHFRFGAGAQLFVPFGNRADYITDGTVRGMIRALIAGDAPWFTYAAQVGVHIRPLDDAPTAGSPRGSELLFGVAAGARLPVGHSGRWTAVIGPEVYGATAFRAFFGGATTAVEGLLSGRIEGTGETGAHFRIKLGAGAGLNPHFGAPDWRVLVGVELFGRSQARPPTPPIPAPIKAPMPAPIPAPIEAPIPAPI